MSFEKTNHLTSEIKEKQITVNSIDGITTKLSPEINKDLADVQNNIDKLQNKIEQNPNEVLAEKNNFIAEFNDVKKNYNAIKEKIEQEGEISSIESIPQLKEISMQIKEVQNSLNTLDVKEIEDPIFKPFIGEKYNEGINNKKVLILGDSHYFGKEHMDIYNKDKTDDRISGVTKGIVEQYKNYISGNEQHHKWMNTFTKGYTILDIEDRSKGKIKDTIDKSAFYNYVQTPMEKPREKPSDIDYKNAEKPFRNVLKELQPDVVFVWGNRTWSFLPEDLKNNESIAFVQITHPSASINYQKEYEKIKQVL